MGGGIGVESAAGGGRRFWFEVPLAAGDEAALAAAPADALPAVRPLRVLVAEDVELNRDLLADVLGRHGHRVVLAADGREAVERAGEGGFDLVLMDMQMPFVDGIEATRRIRALPAPAGQVPVAGLTANVLERDRRRCLEAGMDECLGKPIDRGRLFAAMARHTGDSRRDAGAGVADAAVREGPAPGAGAGQAPAGPSSPAGAAVPLVDRAMLEGLAARLQPEAFAGLVRPGLGNAERTCGRLGALPAGSEELVREAHSLRGTSGSFGLRRISALAGEIEAAAQAGEDVSGPVERLGEAVGTTWAELRAAGLLGEPRAVDA